MKFVFNEKALNLDLTIAEGGLENNSIIFETKTQDINGGRYWFNKEINIKLIKVSKSNNYKNNQEIIGVSKLCLLKEVSKKILYVQLEKLPDLIYYFIQILSVGYITDNSFEIKNTIKNVLEKMKGSNIINFSNYVDEIVDSNK